MSPQILFALAGTLSQLQHFAAMTRGIFRDGDRAHSTRDGKSTFPVARRIYELNSYQPPFDQLPTREAYGETLARPAA